MKKLIKWFLSLSRVSKRLLMILVDFVTIILVILSSFSLRLGEWYLPYGEIIYLVLVVFKPRLVLVVFN